MGRLVATVLMVAGIALLGTVNATLASWLLEQVSQTEEREVSDLRTEIEVLNIKIDQLMKNNSHTVSRLTDGPLSTNSDRDQ